ncbi:MAG: sigma-70 family RNA polymerase sigma factor [Planctomycetota bacterium]|nr:sigma-70 family RNA polymerase sigma factor [Planctomycetota bacterium]
MDNDLLKSESCVDEPWRRGENMARVSKRDNQFVARVLAGDATAFGGLYDAHAGGVKAFFLRGGAGDADAEDLTQETFSRAFKSIKTYDARKGEFLTWVGAIARNVVRRHWGRRKQPDGMDPELAEEMFATYDNPGQAAAAGEEVQAIAGCVGALPQELGRLVRLRYVEGRTTRGVGEAAGVPEATVRSRLAEAHALLLACMRGKGFLAADVVE